MGTRADAPPGPLLKYSAYVVKNPNISEEEFHSHWRAHHARNPLEAMKKHGVVRYTQYHCTAATRSLLNPMCAARQVNPLGIKFQIVPYDGIVQIWFKDWESWMAVAKEPIFGQAIFEDEEYLFDCSKGYVTLGWEEDMLRDGDIVMPKYEGLGKCQCICQKCEGECTK